MPQDQAKYLLEGLLAFGNQFEELVLLNMDGNEQIVVHRYRLVVSSDLNSRAGDPVFQQVRKSRKSFFSQVFFQNETGEPLIQIGEPVFRVGDGRMQAVLMAKLRLKAIWDLLAAIPSQSGQTVYILDNRNQVVAHPDPSVVLRGTSLDTPESVKPLGLDGERVIRATKPLNLGNQQFTVVAERPRRLALELAWDNLRLLAILGLFAPEHDRGLDIPDGAPVHQAGAPPDAHRPGHRTGRPETAHGPGPQGRGGRAVPGL